LLRSIGKGEKRLNNEQVQKRFGGGTSLYSSRRLEFSISLQKQDYRKIMTLQRQDTLNRTKTTHHPEWHNAVAGGMAGAGARLATAPLDLLRIRWQLETNVTYPRPGMLESLTKIAKQEGGVTALFRGSVAATYLWIGYAMVQFALYARVQEWLVQNASHYTTDGKPLHPTAVAFVSGAMAGVSATLSTYPFDICRTIFAARGIISQHPTPPLSSSPPSPLPSTVISPKATTTGTPSSPTLSSLSPPKSLHQFALAMYRQKGIRAFYAGAAPASVQIMPYMGLNFAIYDSLTRGDKRSSTSSMAGTVSGAVSKLIVYPMDTVKKRLQVQSAFGAEGSGHRMYTGMSDCIVTMLRTEGVASFYRGLVPSILKTSLSSGLTFGLFRFTKNGLEAIQDWYSSHDDHNGPLPPRPQPLSKIDHQLK
jgi:solute carrier family 25 (mitochondrial thiamine pyrophosphate transporter), member 19